MARILRSYADDPVLSADHEIRLRKQGGGSAAELSLLSISKRMGMRVSISADIEGISGIVSEGRDFIGRSMYPSGRFAVFNSLQEKGRAA